MPTVTQYQSQGTLTTAHATPTVSPAGEADNASAGIKQTSAAVKTFADVMGRVVDFQETTQAQNLANERLKDIQLRADAEADPKAYGKYVAEIDQAGKDAAGTISGGMAREQFAADHARTSEQVKFTVQQNFWRKQLKAAHADTLKYVEDKKNEYWKTPVDVLKKQTLSDINSKIDQLQASQAIDPEQAMKWKMEVQKDLPYGQAVQDANIDPLRTKALLEQGYYDIQDPEKLSTAIKYATSQAKTQDQMAKKAQTEAQDNTETDMFLRIQQVHNGDQNASPVTPIDIENAWKAGNLSPEGTRRLTMQLNKPTVATGDSGVYSSYLDQIYSGKVQAGTPSRELRNQIMDDPDLSAKQKIHLTEAIRWKDGSGNRVNLAYNAAQPDQSSGFWGTAWNFVKNMFPHNSDHATDVISQLHDDVKAGKISPEQIMEAAKNMSAGKALKVNPRLSTARKGGDIATDKFGNKAMVFPDGTYEPIDPAGEEAQDPNADDQGGME